MAHYAILNEDNVVINVIPGKDENEDGIDWENFYSVQTGKRCLRTSYNTANGIHKEGGIPFRHNYAGIGYTYFDDLDAFIPPNPYKKWIFDETIMFWIPPIPKPDAIYFFWDDINEGWVVLDESPTQPEIIHKMLKTQSALTYSSIES